MVVLSTDMDSYLAHGCCPRCGADLLADVSLFTRRTVTTARLTLTHAQTIRKGHISRIAPQHSSVRYLRDAQLLQCVLCQHSWRISGEDPTAPSLPAREPAALSTISVQRPDGARTSSQQPARSLWSRVRRTKDPNPPRGSQDSASSKEMRTIDLATCVVTGVAKERSVETLLSIERKTYTNHSKVATLIKEISLSHSITRTITVDDRSVKARNVEGGVRLVGVATMQKNVQDELSHRYSVASELTLSVAEKTTISIPPSSTVEHVIRWNIISLEGVAILAGTPGDASDHLAEVPFRFPERLGYTDTLHDVHEGAGG